MNHKEHWDQVYQAKAPRDVSWYQARPAVSLKLIEPCAVSKDQGIIDVGGGASVLVDFLLDAGFRRLAVLDISAVALAHARQRLGARALAVEWGAFQVRVNSIAPGSFPDLAQLDPEIVRQRNANAAANVPLGRTGQLREVGLLALYLVSDASSFVTGQTWVIDGGAGLM